MEYVRLGHAGPRVSRLCLGTMNFGPETSEADARAIMDAALDAGITFFDTANVYGRRRGEGITEQIIGRWFAQGGGRRERVVLATKVYGAMSDSPNDRGLSARHVGAAVEGSLRRLQTDHIDLYQMHHVDRETPIEETLNALHALVDTGAVLNIGSSNFAGWHIARAQEVAQRLGLTPLVSEQCHYNLLERGAEEEVLPAAREYGMGVLPWSPLRFGVLGGILAKPAEGRAVSSTTQRVLAEHRSAIARYEALCESAALHPAAVALRWLLDQPGVTAPIIGPRTLDQLHSARAALDATLDDAFVSELNAVFPPRGPAPEAWAW